MKLFYFLSSVFGYLFSKLNTRQLSRFQPLRLSKTMDHNQNPTKAFPKVSIIIPTRDKPELLRNCINSVLETTRHLEVEVIVVDNNSKEAATTSLFEELTSEGIRVLKYPRKFNYSEICNYAVSKSTGGVLCFLNNDTEALSNDWLRSMTEHALRDEVGVVGAVLQFQDKSIQHMGIALGYNGIAGHPNQGKKIEDWVPNYCYEVSAVTFACAVISRAKFDLIGGLDTSFPVGFNDVDFAIRSRANNFRNVVCTRAVLTHFESQSRPKSSSFPGFLQAMSDVIKITAKHPGKLVDRFFVD
jgi:GT2 family glycosyltransferase